MQQKVLVVDDEESIVRLVDYNLQKAGYRTALAYDAAEALALLGAENPDAIILDVMLPDMDGFDLCREIRKRSSVPVIFLTARDADWAKITGLELGADDYLTKPFSPGELVARVRAILRRMDTRKAQAAGKTLRFGPLAIEPERREVKVEGQEVTLTAKEFDLLVALAENNGRVLTREQLLTNVWGGDYYGDQRVVDVHIRHLREKLGPAADTVQTVRGVGYKFRGAP